MFGSVRERSYEQIKKCILYNLYVYSHGGREGTNNAFRSGNRNFIRPGNLFLVYLDRPSKPNRHPKIIISC